MGALRSLTTACVLLVLVPAVVNAEGTAGDLTVKLSKLDLPSRITSGRQASFSVRYIVTGPSTRRALATVNLALQGASVYRVKSVPAQVRPAIWKWNVEDTIPAALLPGRYSAVATVTLTRAGKRIAQAIRRGTLRVAAG